MNALIILGGGLTSDFKLNTHTIERFEKALSLIDDFDIIICSTDKSYRKIDEIRHTSEARVGRDYLISKGVDSDKIYLEEKSRDTFSNAYFCRKDIIDPLSIKNMTIVTSKFHMPKSKFVFELVFPKPEFNLEFVESSNGDVDEDQLKNRLLSEQIVLDFYTTKLVDAYSIASGDMVLIGNYILNVNPSFTGKKDKLHQEMTEKIEKALLGNNPLY